MQEASQSIIDAVSSEIEEIEVTIKEMQKLVDTGDRVERLIKNKDFEDLIMKHYFENEVVRLGMLVSEPNLTDHQRSCVQRDLEAIGSFQRFLRHTSMAGYNARQSIEEHEEELAEVQASQDTFVTGSENYED